MKFNSIVRLLSALLLAAGLVSCTTVTEPPVAAAYQQPVYAAPQQYAGQGQVAVTGGASAGFNYQPGTPQQNYSEGNTTQRSGTMTFRVRGDAPNAVCSAVHAAVAQKAAAHFQSTRGSWPDKATLCTWAQQEFSSRGHNLTPTTSVGAKGCFLLEVQGGQTQVQAPVPTSTPVTTVTSSTSTLVTATPPEQARLQAFLSDPAP